MFRPIAVLAALAVLAAMFVGGSTANATDRTGDHFSCVFEGLAGQLTPGIQDIAHDLQDPNPLDIEHGWYSFRGDATCVGRAGATIIAPSAAQPQNVAIVSDGEYDSILCGTGSAYDRSGAGTTLVANGTQINDFGYEIKFVGGNGAILIGSGTNGPVLTTGAYVGSGAVLITPGDPTANPPDTDNCVLDNNDGDNLPDGDGTTDKFLVVGAFSADGKLTPHELRR